MGHNGPPRFSLALKAAELETRPAVALARGLIDDSHWWTVVAAARELGARARPRSSRVRFDDLSERIRRHDGVLALARPYAERERGQLVIARLIEIAAAPQDGEWTQTRAADRMVTRAGSCAVYVDAPLPPGSPQREPRDVPRNLDGVATVVRRGAHCCVRCGAAIAKDHRTRGLNYCSPCRGEFAKLPEERANGLKRQYKEAARRLLDGAVESLAGCVERDRPLVVAFDAPSRSRAKRLRARNPAARAGDH